MKWVTIHIGQLLLALNCLGANFYVATNGNDAADGSIGTPWQHLRYGVINMGANNTLFVRGGATPETAWVYPFHLFRLQEFINGTGTNYTTIKTYPGEYAVYKPADYDTCVVLQDVTNVWIEGLKVDGILGNSACLKVATSGAELAGNIVITNMSFYGMRQGHGILTNGKDRGLPLLITHCDFYTNGWAATNGGGGPYHQIYVQDSYVTVEYCSIKGMTNEQGGGYGVHVFNSGLTNVTVRNTSITECTDAAIGLLSTKGSNNYAYNNIIYRNTGIGIKLQNTLINYVLSNTLLSNANAILCDQSTNCFIEDNIATLNYRVDSRGTIGIVASDSIAVRNNLAYSNFFVLGGNWYDYLAQTSVNLTTNGNQFQFTVGFTNYGLYDAKFVNPASADFRLSLGSSGIGNAITQTLFSNDFSNRIRIEPWDKGALAFLFQVTNYPIVVGTLYK